MSNSDPEGKNAADHLIKSLSIFDDAADHVNDKLKSLGFEKNPDWEASEQRKEKERVEQKKMKEELMLQYDEFDHELYWNGYTEAPFPYNFKELREEYINSTSIHPNFRMGGDVIIKHGEEFLVELIAEPYLESAKKEAAQEKALEDKKEQILQLQIGMSKSKVLSIFGEPFDSKRTVTKSAENLTWYYFGKKNNRGNMKYSLSIKIKNNKVASWSEE